jgi:SAM-dependent methyltransferase
MKFLAPEDTKEMISIGFYQSPMWPEAFWRRRKTHAKRPDPEIQFIKDLHPKSVLEIGSAYGRVTKKIINLQQEIDTSFPTLEITGLELNPNFQEYIDFYSEEFPELLKAKFVFGSIFDAENVFPESYFDLVVIPMNTVPNFPFEKLDLLFKNLRYIIKQNGHCIFSVHKRKIDEKMILSEKDWLDGELLVERGKNPIASICYGFPIEKTDYGHSSIYYCKYFLLNNKMNSEKKIISRSVTEFFNVDALEEIIKNNGFQVHFVDEESFSRVYCIKKE